MVDILQCKIDDFVFNTAPLNLFAVDMHCHGTRSRIFITPNRLDGVISEQGWVVLFGALESCLVILTIEALESQ